MYALKFHPRALLPAIVVLLLAGCASNPAPVSNHSFGANAVSTAPAQPGAASTNGTRTFGIGGHANGTVGAQGYTVAQGDTLYSIAFAHGMDVRQLAALNGIAPPYTIYPGQVLKLRPGQAAQASSIGTTLTTTNTMGVSATAQPPAAASTPAQPAAPVFGPVTTQNVTATGVATASSTAAAVPQPVTAASTLPPAPAASVPPVPSTAAAATPTPPPGATRTVAGIAWAWPASGKVISGFSGGSGGEGAGLDIAGNLGDPVRAAAAGTVVYSGDGLIGYGQLIIIKHSDTYLSAYGHNSKRLVKEGDHVSAGQEIALMGNSGAPRVELHFEIRKDGKPVDPLQYLPQR